MASGTFKSAQEMYKFFVSPPVEITPSPSNNVNSTKELERMIRLDLARTDVRNGVFNDEKTVSSRQNPLFNILFAYAHMDPRIGYVQGLNLLSAFFLNSFCPDSKKM